VIGVLLIQAAILAAALVAAVAIGGTATAATPSRWATANGIALSPATRPALDAFLTMRRNLGRVGAFAGLVLPPAVTAATGADLGLAGLSWVLFGYLCGHLVAERCFTLVARPGARSASLTTRRLLDYLPRTLVVAQVAFPALALAVAAFVAAVGIDGPAPFWTSGAPVPVDPDVAVVAAAPVAAVLALVSIVGQLRLVRRPQPAVDPDLVALDDAMRSTTVRTVAATSVGLSSLLLLNQLGLLATALGSSPLAGWIWAAGALLLLIAYLAWPRWVNRGWRVRNRDVTGRGPTDVEVAGA
jgi:hypothetical protein